MKFIPFFLEAEEDSWLKIINDIFALEMGEYENLGFGDFAFTNLRGIIIGMVAGIIIASYLSIFNKRVHGSFVSSVIELGASTPATAKTLSELGYMKNSAVRSAIRSGNTYRGILRCVEAEEYYFARELARGEYEAKVAASGEAAPPFESPEFKYDFEKAHFYIPEDKHYGASIRFEKKGTSIFSAVAMTVVSIVMLWAILKFFPDIMQLLDNFVGMLNGTR
ncbi:MAG: hypothetical protein J6S71_04850 [Clostridia bacterium]|nr:hypothetical protein [Clostridia bacterium]